MRQILFILCLFCTQFLLSQSIDERLQTHQAAYHLEKIYISHNQPYYASGDTLYGKIFLVDGRNHQYFDGTPIVYVDWISESGTILESLVVKIKEGTANITIPLSRENGEGRFLLRAYTQYQKNFEEHFIFQKEIKVIGEEPLVKKNKQGDKTAYSVQFFPEGGQLITGLTSNLAFQARNGHGEPIDIAGAILNKSNEPVGQFKSFNEGIGVVNFRPLPGEKYQAKVTWNGLIRFFDLPQILKEGFVLKVNNRKKEAVSLQLTTNTKDGLKNCTLVGHLRGQPFLTQVFTDGNAQKLLLDKKQIPSGVLHFTIFDSQERPVAERLVYNNNPTEEVTIKIDLPKKQYGVKEPVNAVLTSTIGEQPIRGDLTVTVYNKEIFSGGAAVSNIKNYLLLQSDLKGRINNINQYFEKDDAKSRTLLDYVMLTHGWRRFNWQDVLAETPIPIVFPTEENISFAGKIMKDNNRKTPVKGDVFLSVMDANNFTSTNLTTDEDGLFYFKGLDIFAPTEVLFQGNIHNAKKKKKQKEGQAIRTGNKNVQIELLSLHDLDFNDTISLKGIPYNKEAQKMFATEVNRIRKVDTIYHPEWSIDLEAVTVKASRLAESRKKEADTRRKFKDRGLFYSANSQKIYMNELAAGGAIYKDVYEVIRNRVGGAQIIGTDEGKQVLLRAQSSLQNPTYATIELDGTLVSASTAASIDPSNIDMIDVKRGLSVTAVYGEAGNGGIITIITKDPAANTRNLRRPGVLAIDHPGYHQARTFYVPDYKNNSIERQKPDYRTTLYWSTNAKLEGEPLPLQFYTGDKLSEFLIFVEGLTTDGIPFIGQEVIRVGQ